MNTSLLNSWPKKVGFGIVLLSIFVFLKWYNYNYYSIVAYNQSKDEVCDVLIHGDGFELVVGCLRPGIFSHKTGPYIDIPSPVTVSWSDSNGKLYSDTIDTSEYVPSRLREVTVNFYVNGPNDVTVVTSDWKDRPYKGE